MERIEEGRVVVEGQRGPAAYFERESATRFRPTPHVGGGWNPDEQHIAPAIGLLAHLIERDRDQRRGDDLAISRLSCDILGTLPLESIEIEIDVLRPGRTIELVEARLVHDGRCAALARAWLVGRHDTRGYAGTPLARIAAPDDLPSRDPGRLWPGGFVRSVEARGAGGEPGRATFWIRTDVELVAGEAASPTARMLGFVDIANGATPRVSAEQVFFPNLDLTAHIFREPRGDWVGFDTYVSFGPDGLGLTHSVLHDTTGPLGAVEQTLTVRPR